MSKFNVFVAVEGQRDALLGYFADQAVTRLFSVADCTSSVSAAEGASEVEVGELGVEVGSDVMNVPESSLLVDGVYELRDKEQVLLGWTVALDVDEDLI